MGSPQTRDIGGGNAINTADAFNNFLTSIIGGNVGGSGRRGFNTPGGGGGIQNAGAQTTAFRRSVDTQLAGTGADRGQFSDYFSGLQPGRTGVTPQDFSFTPGELLNVDLNSPEFSALRQIQTRQTDLDAANLRSQFSQFGAGGRGTGAAHAVGNFLAEANPRNILAQGELARGFQGLDLQNRVANNQNRLGLIGAQQGQDQLGQAFEELRSRTGLNLNAQSMQGIQQMLQLIFGGLGQSNQLGTPQRQTVQVPNAWQRITGGINDVLGIAQGVTSLFNPSPSP